jgi:GNAT superfamily N-acetyltransferase
MADAIPYLLISMIRSDLENIPQFALPPDYSVRWYQPGDERHWCDIHLAADRHNVITPELFAEQFGTDADLLHQRQMYLADLSGRTFATATAWFNDDYRGQFYGRVHWVAIAPEMQGRGLAKPLMTILCARMHALGHVRAYLTTEAARIPAIRLYLKFGFVPEINDERDAAIWRDLEPHLRSSG